MINQQDSAAVARTEWPNRLHTVTLFSYAGADEVVSDCLAGSLSAWLVASLSEVRRASWERFRNSRRLAVPKQAAASAMIGIH